MKRWQKVLIGIGTALAILAVVALGVAGNFFYELALSTATDKSIVFDNETTGGSTDITFSSSEREIWEARNPEDVYLTNVDGYKLHSYKLDQNSDTWVVVVHGYLSQGIEMAAPANHFADLGYNVLVPDLRAHGESEGTTIGMGAWDSRDVLEWVDTLVKDDPDCKVVLYGVSMGASTVMMATGQDDIPENVVAAIEDCGYTSTWDEFSYQLDAIFGLPETPFLDVANIFAQIRGGYDLHDADARAAVERSHTPTLFIHGDADAFVPTHMVDVLYDAAACEKDKLIIEGAGHGMSRTTDPETYWTHVNAWIEKYAGA